MITVFFPYLGPLFRRCLFSSVYPVSQVLHLGVDIPAINRTARVGSHSREVA